MTIYYEIIGYLPSGGYIQKDYDYGYVPPKSEHDYRYNVNNGIRVYRITQTNSSGHVFEFSARQVQEWCKLNDIRPVIQYYYGYAKDLYPDIPARRYRKMAPKVQAVCEKYGLNYNNASLVKQYGSELKRIVKYAFPFKK